MARGQKQLINSPELEQLKYEVASELGIDLNRGGELTAREAGAVGGEMVKRMIAYAENALSQQKR